MPIREITMDEAIDKWLSDVDIADIADAVTSARVDFVEEDTHYDPYIWNPPPLQYATEPVTVDKIAYAKNFSADERPAKMSDEHKELDEFLEGFTVK